MQQPAKFFFKRLKSTNLYINQMLEKHASRQPFWVRTDHQYAGKGQGSKSWITEPGKNITGSLAIFPNSLEASHQFSLSQVFAIAAAGFLEQFTDHVHIKWPNDLYVGNKKIGGILIETAVQGTSVYYAILGIGMNINQTEFHPTLPNPISLSCLTGKQYDLKEMEELFLESFHNHYQMIESEQFDCINDLYISKLYGFGTPFEFITPNESFTATIIGVTEFGHLIIQRDSGLKEAYDYQKIMYVIPS